MRNRQQAKVDFRIGARDVANVAKNFGIAFASEISFLWQSNTTINQIASPLNAKIAVIHRTLEERLMRAAGVWKWQAVIKSTAMVLSCSLLAALLVGTLVHLDWITRQSVAYLMIASAVVICVVAWITMMIRAVERKLDRRWLAAAVEHDQEQLMDRFNAAVELEARPDDASSKMYRGAIERQALNLLRKHPDRSPFSWLTNSGSMPCRIS